MQENLEPRLDNNDANPVKHKYGSRVSSIIDTAVKHPDLSLSQIAKINEVSKTTVYNTLERYGINQHELKEYQDNSKAYWDAASQKSLNAYLRLNEEEIKSLVLKRGLVDGAIAADKASLSQGLDKSQQPLVIINKISINGKVEGNNEPIDIEQEIGVK